MLIGYARTSTIDQTAGLDAQVRDLKARGVEKIFSEHISGASAARPELQQALSHAREGDIFVVTKLDRLARSTRHLLEIVEVLEGKKVGLRVLDFGGGEVDSGSPQGRLMLTMFAAFGEFERQLMLERQREGIAKAKSEGKYKGRAPTAQAKSDDVLRLRSEGVGPSEIARQTGISRASVYRILGVADHVPAGQVSPQHFRTRTPLETAE